MKMTDKFGDFVKQQIDTSVGGGELDINKEKTAWIENLNKLYALVRESLGEYLSSNQIQIKFSTLYLTEELLGTYAAQEAQINIGRQVVKLKPVGTFLIGARGRVDMTGPRGVTRFVIVSPDATAPKVRVTILKPGDAHPPSEPIAPPETWVWKIATPPPQITYIDLTKETFREALMGVVNG